MIAAILLAVTPPGPTAGDSLYGTVRVAGTGEPVPGVRVSVRGRPETVVSDSAGLYVLRDIPGGRIEVLFERLGFEAQALSVTPAADGAARVDVDLAAVPVALPPVTVALPDVGPTQPDASEIGSLWLTPAHATRDPLAAAPDVFAAITSAAFTTGRDELTPSIHVRGGAGDENLILLDGIPWRGPRPLGGIAGLMPVGAVANVDVHTAAPPARYGDALSSLIVVHPREADDLTVEGSLDGSMVEQTVGSRLPLDGASILLSGRWTYRSVFNQPEGGESDNGFRDGVGRLSMSAGPGLLALYYVDGRDRLAFPAAPESSSTAMNHFSSAGSLAGAVWTSPPGASPTVHARIWSSRITSDGAWGARTMESGLRNVGLSADYAADRTEVGFTFARTVTTYRVRDSSVTAFALNGAPLVAAAFASRRWTVAAPWAVSTGVRLNVTSTWGLQLEPRLWTRLALGRGVVASLGYARLHQYVQSARNEESVLDALLGMDLPVAATRGMPPARSDQITAALEASVGARASFLIEAYARRLTGLALVAPVTRLPFADRTIPIGSGSVRGADATFAYQGHRLDVRAQLSLLEGSRVTGPYHYRPSDDVERVSLGVGYSPGSLGLFRVMASVGKGRPTTTLQEGLQLDPYAPMDGAGSLTGSPVAMPGALNTGGLPTYSRLDLGFSRDWELRGGARINTAFTVTNLLDHHNVLAYVAAPDGARPVLLIPRAISLRLRWAVGSPR